MVDTCRNAVVTAYQELRGKGQEDCHAFTVAVDVFRCHNPHIQRGLAIDLVADWVCDALGQ